MNNKHFRRCEQYLQARSLVCHLAEVKDWNAWLSRGGLARAHGVVHGMLSLTLALVASARVVHEAEVRGVFPVLGRTANIFYGACSFHFRSRKAILVLQAKTLKKATTPVVL